MSWYACSIGATTKLFLFDLTTLIPLGLFSHSRPIDGEVLKRRLVARVRHLFGAGRIVFGLAPAFFCVHDR
jgi:hypothetical protein